MTPLSSRRYPINNDCPPICPIVGAQSEGLRCSGERGRGHEVQAWSQYNQLQNTHNRSSRRSGATIHTQKVQENASPFVRTDPSYCPSAEPRGLWCNNPRDTLDARGEVYVEERMMGVSCWEVAEVAVVVRSALIFHTLFLWMKMDNI